LSVKSEEDEDPGSLYKAATRFPPYPIVDALFKDTQCFFYSNENVYKMPVWGTI